MVPRFLPSAIALLLLAAHTNLAFGQADATRGLELSKRWCNSCHIISPDDTSWDDGEVAPRFSALTKTTREKLAALLAKGHAEMEALSKLTAAEIDDLVAHLQRLKPDPR